MTPVLLRVMVRLSSAPLPTPVDMALNHGTRCAPGVLEVLRRHADSTCLRFYGPTDDGALRAAIAKHASVPAAHVLVANGSGPLLKSVIPYVIEQRIRASVVRMTQHLLLKRGYPMIVTSPTYSKVPASAHRVGLVFESITLEPEQGFALNVAELRRRLQKRDGLAYICNPNNPTGNLLIDRAGLEPLLTEFPRSFFFVDEAYADYLAPSKRPELSELCLRHDNLLILRSFSFAHGLAGAHVGYALTHPKLVEAMMARATPHQVSRLSADLASASLADPQHLENVRREISSERERLLSGLRNLPGIQVFDSETNFIYGRFRDGRRAADLAQALRTRGLLIKIFEPVGETPFDEYFRFTVGLPEENSFLLEQLEEHLSPRSASSNGRPARARVEWPSYSGSSMA